MVGNSSSTAKYLTPVPVDTSGALAGKTIKKIASGNEHTCALASDSAVYCWGRNHYGQIGNGATTNALAPVAVNTSGVLAGRTIKQISQDSNHTCAITTEGLTYCWGYNSDGQVGGNTTTTRTTPTAVSTSDVLTGKTAKYISAGGFTSCVIASDDKLYCWGYNYSGRLGS